MASTLQSMAPSLPAGSRLLTLFADRGERYMDLVYATGVGGVRPAVLREPVEVK